MIRNHLPILLCGIDVVTITNCDMNKFHMTNAKIFKSHILRVCC